MHPRSRGQSTRPTSAPITRLRSWDNWFSLCRSLPRLLLSLAIQDGRWSLAMVLRVKRNRRDTTFHAAAQLERENEVLATPMLSASPNTHYVWRTRRSRTGSA
jgi:hypothetical protein